MTHRFVPAAEITSVQTAGLIVRRLTCHGWAGGGGVGAGFLPSMFSMSIAEKKSWSLPLLAFAFAVLVELGLADDPVPRLVEDREELGVDLPLACRVVAGPNRG